MLAKRVIPTILTKNGQLVKGIGFASDRVVGNALQSARIHSMRSVDEILLLDVTATDEGREPDYAMVRRLADGCFSPLTVGGGIMSDHHVRGLLCAGADKVLIGFRKHALIKPLSEKFGKQCISVSIDVDDNYAEAIARAQKAQNSGAGEILLQSIPRDGTQEGYDLDLIKYVTDAVGIPVIASGGCSGYEDMQKAIESGADAVAAGALYTFTDSTPTCAAVWLNDKGIEVRLAT